MTLKERIENIVGEWLCINGLSISDDRCDVLVANILKVFDEETTDSTQP